MVVPAHPSETGSYFDGDDYVTFYTKGYIERRVAIESVYYLGEHIIDFSGVTTRLNGRPLEPLPNTNPFAYMTIIEPADLFDPYFFESKFPTNNPKKSTIQISVKKKSKKNLGFSIVSVGSKFILFGIFTVITPNYAPRFQPQRESPPPTPSPTQPRCT